MMRRTKVLGIAIACSVGLVLAGCGGETGEALPGDGKTVTSTAARTTAGAASTTAGSAAPGESGAESGSAAPDPVDPPEPGDKPGEGAPATGPAAEPAPEPAEPTPAPGGAGLWDPCALPESALSAAGLDASTEQNITGSWRPDWLTCQWQSADGAFDMTVVSTDRSLDEVRQDPEFKEYTSVYVDGRDAVKYRSIQDVNMSTCAVSVVVPDGSVMFSLRLHGGKPEVGQSCGQTAVVSEALAAYLP
ncbi:DUF3558 domain-containing protein [Nocardia cyriacigeorgica]|uniref:DUF3558 domain-containing protein n=1 Tax=Nocardia cyriacigeorgica TaxID=135487 RepID=A0A5R8NJI3_9NOCA|nr:DUF3558 domain-containing protein [Nocardia cyriacigeorgica]TLF75842.1 DUF3558 domain-containing protein [Nocardia cyriacigeorgica]